MSGRRKFNRRATCQYKSAGQRPNFMNILDYQLAEIAITYSHRIPPRDRFKINCSRDAYDVIQQFWPAFDTVEYFYVIFMNRSNHVLGFHQISKGGITGTIVDVHIIVAIALKTLSKGIICVHNHPSGNLTPSDADVSLTRKLKDACNLVDIKMLDHLIVTSETYLSMADEGHC